ncbi:hypothetical protein AGLY_007882 [Aphis glycines]|uniref:Uncharacterized protein n=1 Tax=Aphis glycines TaxID=307491 RepID=A0A6G0TNQ7_APHGL|nr:hypothetical protein AGLY_007882 [Aphis glycines]
MPKRKKNQGSRQKIIRPPREYATGYCIELNTSSALYLNNATMYGHRPFAPKKMNSVCIQPICAKIKKTANLRQIYLLWFAADLTRTTNNCESFHSHFNEQFYKSHPNIFTFLEILIKTVQTDVYIKINSCIKNIPNSRKNAQVKARLKKTLKAIDNYTNEKLTRYEYVQIVAFNYNKDQDDIINNLLPIVASRYTYYLCVPEEIIKIHKKKLHKTSLTTVSYSYRTTLDV